MTNKEYEDTYTGIIRAREKTLSLAQVNMIYRSLFLMDGKPAYPELSKIGLHCLVADLMSVFSQGVCEGLELARGYHSNKGVV